MTISRSLVIAVLLVVGLCLSTAKFTRAQPGQTVSVRPRLTANQPGMPEVKVAVDRNRVPLGEEVIFTLSPAHVVTDSRYKVTLFFGDDAKWVMSQPKKTHLYTKPGNYTYSILVEPAAQQPKSTPTPALAIPDVRLMATPTSAEINQPVTLAAQLSHPYPNIQYRFVFGDGSGGNWQTEAKATHAYRSKGAYLAYVDLGVSANGSIKKAGGSKRESIQVNEPARPANVALKLSASVTSVNVAALVTFTAQVNSPQPNARYRFDFGDQTASTGWLAGPQATHRYSSAGNFSARAEVRVVSRTGAQSANSNPVPIEVKNDSASKPTVALKLTPESMPLGLPAFFRAIPSVADSKTRYRFNFGDSASPTEWSSEPSLTHIYASPGAYSAFAEIGSVGNQGVDAVAASAQRRVEIMLVLPPDNTNGNSNTNDNGNSNSNNSGNANSNLAGSTNGNANSGNSSQSSSPLATASSTPIATPIESSSNWWKYLIILAMILFAGYQAASYLFVPRPTFVPHVDAGQANVGAGSLAIDLQVDVDPNVAGGEFTLNTEGGSLIKSARSE